jgi:hypothetical protein
MPIQNAMKLALIMQGIIHEIVNISSKEKRRCHKMSRKNALMKSAITIRTKKAG